MVQITTHEHNNKLVFEHIVLTSNDIWPYPLVEKRVHDARKWIRKQGYHLRHSGGYAAIRLEKNSYTIIEVKTDVGRFIIGKLTNDCICYATMLLYRRLKRDGVIV